MYKIAFVDHIVCIQKDTFHVWGNTALCVAHHCKAHNKWPKCVVTKLVGFVRAAVNYCGG